MQTHIATTPFGRRPMTLGMMASQARVAAMPREAIAHKWQVFQHIREARAQIGATDRALAILNALLSFHPATALHGDEALIVWPSNEQLMARANGMPATTLRRHLAVLVDCGLIIRRDSPNGKRYARKGRDGTVEQAFGFDLSPIVARAAEFRALAEAVEADRRAAKAARERLTILRRDVVKMIEAGIEEGAPGDWGRVALQYQAAIGRLARKASHDQVDGVAEELRLLRDEIRISLDRFAESKNPAANESRNGGHIHNSKPDLPSDSEKGIERGDESRTSAPTSTVHSLPRRELPLGILLDACPDLRDYGPGGAIRHWRDALAAAEFARPMLGISPSAWIEAKVILGEREAAAVLAAILQRHAEIRNAGGYLRSLVDRAKAGRFSPWPMVMALVRARLDDGAGRNDILRDSRMMDDLTAGPPRRGAGNPRHSDRKL